MKFDWEVFKIKLTSRKLWLAIVSFVSLLMTARGMDEQYRTDVSYHNGRCVSAWLHNRGGSRGRQRVKDTFNSETHIYNLPLTR